MARPNKRGLDYFPLDVNIFEDEKVAAVAGEFQLKGEIIVIKLLCAIYRNGYFYEWSEMNMMHLLKQLPTVSVALLQGVVERLVRWGFFDKSLFDSSGILTSKSIQERYFTAVSRRRISTADYPYLLITPPGSVSSPPSVKKTVQATLTFVENVTKPGKGKSIDGGRTEPPLRTVIPKDCPYNDGIPRNYQGLVDTLIRMGIPEQQQAQIILLSDYGRKGHPLWEWLYKIEHGPLKGKIHAPGQYLLSKLNAMYQTTD